MITKLFFTLQQNNNLTKKYNLNILLDKKDNSINFNDQEGLLIIAILLDDELNQTLRVYSDSFYHIVHIKKIAKYLEYYFAIYYDNWTK